MSQASTPRVVKCPACSKPVPWVPESRFRPFCSDRCRNVDLGAWASEAYRVPEVAPKEPETPDGTN